MRVLYIAGTGRSGSTLLSRLLGDLDDLAPAGELRYVFERGVIANHLCGCGLAFADCQHWQAVLDAAYGGRAALDAAAVVARAAAIDRIRHIPRLVVPRLRRGRFADGFERHVNTLGRFYDALAERVGDRIVVDSSKDPSYAFLLRAVPGVDLRVLHLIRDSRAVAHSWTRTRIRPEVQQELAYMKRRPPLRTGLLWSEHNALIDLLGPAGVQVRRMRYEDLVADAGSFVAEVAAFAGASMRPAPVGTVVHDISGNPLRFDGAQRAIRGDMEWVHALSAEDRRVVTAVTAPLLWRYGYRWRRPT